MSKGQCTSCGDVVESKHRHDFVRCKCGKSFLDGGDEYSRYGGYIVPITESYEEPMTAEEFFAYLDDLDKEADWLDSPEEVERPDE
jgi:hypothetical protein